MASTGRTEIGLRLLKCLLLPGLGTGVMFASFHSGGNQPVTRLALNWEVILGAVDGATVRRSLAEILSGPVAFPASKLDSFFRTLTSVTLEKQKVVEQDAGVIGLVDLEGLAGGVLKWSMRLLASVDSSGGVPLHVQALFAVVCRGGVGLQTSFGRHCSVC